MQALLNIQASEIATLGLHYNAKKTNDVVQLVGVTLGSETMTTDSTRIT